MIVNSRNARRLFSLGLNKTLEAVAKEQMYYTANRALSQATGTVAKGLNDSINSLASVKGDLINEAMQVNSTHETTGAFNYNPNNNRNYNYDLANQYMNQYNQYAKAKAMANESSLNLAHEMFKRESKPRK